MTLYDFNKLSLEDKQKVLWKDGEFLDNHITEKEKCNCYALGKLFVEVVYDAESDFDKNSSLKIERSEKKIV